MVTRERHYTLLPFLIQVAVRSVRFSPRGFDKLKTKATRSFALCINTDAYARQPLGNRTRRSSSLPFFIFLASQFLPCLRKSLSSWSLIRKDIGSSQEKMRANGLLRKVNQISYMTAGSSTKKPKKWKQIDRVNIFQCPPPFFFS